MHFSVRRTLSSPDRQAGRVLVALVAPAVATALLTGAARRVATTGAQAAAAPTTTSLLAAAKAAISKQGASPPGGRFEVHHCTDNERVVADLGKKSGTESISTGKRRR